MALTSSWTVALQTPHYPTKTKQKENLMKILKYCNIKTNNYIIIKIKYEIIITVMY